MQYTSKCSEARGHTIAFIRMQSRPSKFTSKHGGTNKHVGAKRGSCRCYSHTQSYAKLANPFKITCAFYTDVDATHVSTRTHSHTHSFTESLTYSLTHYLFTHPLTRSPPYSFTRSPNAHAHTRTLYPSRKQTSQRVC